MVRRNLQALRGTINVDSQPGRAPADLRLPLTLAIIDGFLVVSANRSYVIPLDAVVECIRRPAANMTTTISTCGARFLPDVCAESFNLPGERPRARAWWWCNTPASAPASWWTAWPASCRP